MSIEQAGKLLADARSALFITGAGISAASGIPTYRGVGGLYGDRVTEEGMRIEEALSGPMFRRSPEITWKYIHQIEQACRGASPNAAHATLARMEARLGRSWVLTQNVDGFHRAAGSRNVIDIHGDIHRLLCVGCSFTETVKDYAHLAPCPSCPSCGGVLRPDVVLFGEMLPRAKLERLHRELERGFDVVVSVGTSSLFPYIAEPVLQAAARGVPTIEVNPEPTVVSHAVGLRLPMGAVEALEGIWRVLER
ncbi:NAD-dependent deacylase [Polyangium spumosum]|uniref:protein acetyllysine N-acetyltransferase n=1 Tax=Polyangium spumosum TaxID=889282 RepID=A0A6N7PXP5_9BACT|nr:NAD-dependent deacylase [Polyangium spumosum]MRG95636.1 NAD-dependent protein deacylase [Polyangium spumosum]